MEKNKIFYITIVLVVCLVLTGFGAFYLGFKFGEKQNDVDNKEVNNNKKDKEEVKELTKAEKDALVKTEVEELIKILNVSTNSTALGCSDFDDDLFEMPDENVERLEVLGRIAPYLMSCKYGMEYKKVADNNGLGYTYLLDQSMYDTFRSYFATTLNSRLINNQKYYEAFHSSTGGVLRQYDFELSGSGIVEENGTYSAIIDFYENNELGCLVTKALLKLSIKDNHVYYETFEIRNDLVEE